MHSSRGRMKGRQPVQRGATADQLPDSADSFGILPHNHMDRPVSESMGGRKRELRDNERGIGPTLKPHLKRMPMQAAPEHGNHE
jgi:hypothetical protein